MNIEESIEYLKNYKYDNEVRQAIETLLTAYEKEKEKNKELNKYIEDRAKIGKNIQTFINKDYVEQEYISKDKIKAKIEEVKDGTFDAKIVLQSLLEKE